MIVRLDRFQERELTAVVGRQSAEEDSSKIFKPGKLIGQQKFSRPLRKERNNQKS